MVNKDKMTINDSIETIIWLLADPMRVSYVALGISLFTLVIIIYHIRIMERFMTVIRQQFGSKNEYEKVNTEDVFETLETLEISKYDRKEGKPIVLTTEKEDMQSETYRKGKVAGLKRRKTSEGNGVFISDSKMNTGLK